MRLSRLSNRQLRRLLRRAEVRFANEFDYRDLRVNYKRWLNVLANMLLSQLPQSRGKNILQFLKENDRDKWEKFIKIVRKANGVWYEFEDFMEQELK